MGDEFIGNYRIVEKLGEGGMGVVYKAVETVLERPVAIKMLPSELSRDATLMQRFQAEARAQANLNHTNIATLYTFLAHEGNYFMVMEYVDGETFAQLVQRRGPIPAQEMIPLFKQTLLAIGYAHRQGIIHRDIKPGNVMVNRTGIVKVMDFGIAKILGGRHLTRTGSQVGTVSYMSPEQIQNRPIDTRSDVYSLGVTLYEMATGRVPFEADSDFQIMMEHVNVPPPPPSRFYPYLPPSLEGAILKALQKHPGQRFQTVEEFGAALDRMESAALFQSSAAANAGGADVSRIQVTGGGDAAAAARLAPISVPSTPAPHPVSQRVQAPLAAAPITASQTAVSGARLPAALLSRFGKPSKPVVAALGGAAGLVLLAVGLVLWHSSNSVQSKGGSTGTEIAVGTSSEGGASKTDVNHMGLSQPGNDNGSLNSEDPETGEGEVKLASPDEVLKTPGVPPPGTPSGRPGDPQTQPKDPTELEAQDSSEGDSTPSTPSFFQNESQQYLEKANRALQSGSLASPVTESALYYVHEALRLDRSTDAQALEQRVVSAVTTQVATFRGERRFEDASQLVDKLIAYYPNRYDFVETKNAIQRERQQSILQFSPSVQGTSSNASSQQRFDVRHRHVAVGVDPNEPFGVQRSECWGILTVGQNIAQFNCQGTSDPRGQCDQVVFPPGSLKQCKFNKDGTLHVEARKLGNYDFFGEAGVLHGAFQAIAPLVTGK